MNHDSIYSKAPKAYGVKPTDLVISASKLVRQKNPSALDLGAGQGRDSLYLSRRGFAVTAVDVSDIGLKQINEHDDRILTVCSDIAGYEFKQGYDFIIAINVLHFLPKDTALEVIEKVKTHTKDDGIVSISILLDNGKFAANEMKSLFRDFKVVTYEEKTIQDKPHAGTPIPHEHTLARIVARKQVAHKQIQ